MSHDTSHGTAHSTENKPKIALNSAFWFVLILALLFVAAVNFVDVMGHAEGHEGGHEKTEHATGHDAAKHDGSATHEEAGHHATEPAHDAAAAPAAHADSAAHH